MKCVSTLTSPFTRFHPLDSRLLATGLLCAALLFSTGCGVLGGYIGSQIGGRLINHVAAPMIGRAVGQAVGNQIQKELLKPQAPPPAYAQHSPQSRIGSVASTLPVYAQTTAPSSKAALTSRLGCNPPRAPC